MGSSRVVPGAVLGVGSTNVTYQCQVILIWSALPRMPRARPLAFRERWDICIAKLRGDCAGNAAKTIFVRHHVQARWEHVTASASSCATNAAEDDDAEPPPLRANSSSVASNCRDVSRKRVRRVQPVPC